jgi:methionyl aminopeptidase
VRKRRASRAVVLKAPWEIEEMRAANRIVAEVLDLLRRSLVPGISTGELDRIAEEGIIKRGGRPAFKGYHGFPAALCVSINSEVVHGIPSLERILSEGDLVSLDLGAVYHDFFGDAAISATVGTGPELAQVLIDVTREALERGIDCARPRGRLQDISWAVQRHVESAGFSVVRQFVGHGIGKSLHEPPEVPNYGVRGQGALLTPGMVLAIEPMVNIGSSEVRVLEDGWTAVTRDGSLSAHFEHSVAITGDGPDVLSRLN